MTLEINSKILGKALTFSRPGKGYIFVDLNGKEGSLGNQICRGGALVGSTIEYRGDDEMEFGRVCKNWYRAHLKELEKDELWREKIAIKNLQDRLNKEASAAWADDKHFEVENMALLGDVIRLDLVIGRWEDIAFYTVEMDGNRWSVIASQGNSPWLEDIMNMIQDTILRPAPQGQLSYDYTDLMQEIREDLSPSETMQILRADEPINDVYCPIIDWYYSADDMAELIARDPCDDEEEEAERKKMKAQYEKDKPRLEAKSVRAVLEEMEKWNSVL